MCPGRVSFYFSILFDENYRNLFKPVQFSFFLFFFVNYRQNSTENKISL